MNPEQLPTSSNMRAFTRYRQMCVVHVAGAMAAAVLAVGPAWAQTATQAPRPRIEKDLLGDKQIPGDA